MAILVDSLKKLFPSDIKEFVKQQILSQRMRSGSKRALPNYIIIGAQRSGTTSLYDYLTQHPQIIPSFQKQCFYFDRHYEKGIKYYKANFPKIETLAAESNRTNKKIICGEATPDYIFIPECAARLNEELESHGTKLIFINRDPLRRAVSEFNHLPIYRNREADINKHFEKELGFLNTILNENIEYPELYQYYENIPVLIKGFYSLQLKHWKENCNLPLLEITSEDLFKKSQSTYNEVLEFLELDAFKFESFKAQNSSKPQGKIDEVLAQEINRLYSSYNY